MVVIILSILIALLLALNFILVRRLSMQEKEIQRIEARLQRKQREIKRQQSQLYDCKQRLEFAQQGLSGLQKHNQSRRSTVEQHKKQLLEHMRRQGASSSPQLGSVIGVSARTARRYVAELVAEGKVEQTAASGPTTRYKAKL